MMMMSLQRIVSTCLLLLLSSGPTVVTAQSGDGLRGLEATDPDAAGGKIIDGIKAPEARFPYVVSLTYRVGTKSHFCGGSLIGPDLVLTAAHCEIGSDSLIRIVVEPYSIKDPKFYAEEFFVEELRQHPDYGNPNPFSNDLQLIKLDGKSSKTPIVLHTNTSEKLDGDFLTVLGWGTTVQGQIVLPDFLEEQSSLAVNNTFCQEQYAPAFFITPDQLCIDNDGSCQGDSGGPLIIRGNGKFQDRLVGIVSWGIGCRDAVYPGVYARVSEGWAWIRENGCGMTEDLAEYFDCGGFRPTPAPTPQPTLAPTPFPTFRPTPAPTTLSPTSTPSVSAAPTDNNLFITIRFQTDRYPAEIGWSLVLEGAEGGEIYNKTFGDYGDREPESIIEETLLITANKFYTLDVFDRAKDGLCCFWGAGNIGISLGEVYDPTRTLAYKNGEYTDSINFFFYASPGGSFRSDPPSPTPPQSTPTFAPTRIGACTVVNQETGCSVCGDPEKCVQKADEIFAFPDFPAVSCGDLEKAGREGAIPLDQCTFLPDLINDLCGCASPTPAPSAAPSSSPEPSASPSKSLKPSASPTASPAPTFIDSREFLLIFVSDGFPSESAWSVQEMGGAVVRNTQFGDITEPNVDTSYLVTLVMGTQYTLIAYDRFGDGNCCRHGDGEVKIYFGTEKIDENELVALNGTFTSADFVQFRAQDPKIDGPGRVNQGDEENDNDGGSTGGGGDVVVFCFPGDATCVVEGRGDVSMKDVMLGDKVMVEGGKYEPVYSFGHYAPELKAEFIQLVTESTKLELSSDHMVFVDGGRSVPASHVRVGDKLQLASGLYDDVRTVQIVVREGAYAPFTASGALIVNGVKASSFIAFQDSETLQIAGVDTGLTFQFLAHASEAPHRVWCQYFSSCSEEQYTSEGISLWVAAPHKAGLWFIDQNSVVMAVLAVPVLAYLALLAYPLTCISTMLLVAFLATRLTFRVTTSSKS